MGRKRFSPEYIAKIEHASPARQACLRLMRRWDAKISLLVVGLYFIVAVIVSLNLFGIQELANDYDIRNIRNMKYHLIFSSFKEIFGTDNFGRNVFIRALIGTQISIFLGLLYSLLMIPFAVIIGALAGYYGRYFDSIAIYLMSVIVAIPGVLIILSLTKILGASFATIAFALAVTGWVGLARMVRGTVMQSKELDYVLAARNMGAGDWRIIFVHILPNITHFVIIYLVLGFVGIIKAETFLAFVGLTVSGTSSWGILITDGNSDIVANQWQNLIGATSFMFVFLLALNILGDAVRDVLDPKLKNRS
ncbi:MAG: ABC transporter permease [Spirochaetota bacterium]